MDLEHGLESSHAYWDLLADDVLLHIFSYLSAEDLVRVGAVSRTWNRVSKDEFLWKRLFCLNWKIDSFIPLAPGKFSWMNEYKRLKYHIPVVETEVLCEHGHQVLHVSFSHNGEMFASSSKDGYVKVWNATFPATVRHSHDMKLFSWNYTQFSQFNESDTLLLVSGVHFGAHTASGEIAVFNIQDDTMTLQCRVLNKPYDIFGTWYTDDFLLSGRLHFLGHLVSCSALWLNKASQESESEKKQIIKRLFKFYNKNASSIRTIMVANSLAPREELSDGASTSSGVTHDEGEHSGTQYADLLVKGNPVSYNALSSPQWALSSNRRGQSLEVTREYQYDFGAESKEACTMATPIRYSMEYRRAESGEHDEASSDSSDFNDPPLPWDEDWQRLSENDDKDPSTHKIDQQTAKKSIIEDEEDSDDDEGNGEKILDHREKLLIFTKGSLTYTPHQIGFKRIKPFKFAETYIETATLSQRIAEHQERRMAPSVSPDYQDEQSVIHMFDQIDHVIDLHGHIIGMGLSPDHRYLYVNTRPWPKNYVIEHALSPPPIAQEIDIHVIDLVTLKEVGTMLRSHKAYTPNDECFFIFLDVSDQYVASGAEDKHGYLWDRHYGNCLAKLPHADVVNSVAFNPQDPEMLVTASDDFTLKIWRSKNRVNELGINNGPIYTPPRNAAGAQEES